MTKRRANGEGSIYQRKDGRWEACSYQKTVSGKIKRYRVVSKDRETARAKLLVRMAEAEKGILLSDEKWTVGRYLDYWMAEVVAHKNRPRTIELYEGVIRLHLKPALGTTPLTDLNARQFQSIINEMRNDSTGARTIQQARQVLRAALNRAIREEIIHRNVATMVDLPHLERQAITIWTPQQTQEFLTAAEGHRWHAAYVLLCVYGLRRGEVLGLRRQDIDFQAGYIHVRQQLQRVGGVLTEGPVKTSAGRRDLPLTPLVRAALEEYARAHPIEPDAPHGADGQTQEQDLVFRSSTGTPVDPKNFVRTFHQISAEAGLPRIKLHHLRHSAATLLKNLGVPARDAQLILGHANITTTQQIYQHADIAGQKVALDAVERSLATATASTTSHQNYPSNHHQPLSSTHRQTKQNRRLTGVESADLLGGASGARTHDTLLKSLIFHLSDPRLTPVIDELQTRLNTQILGHTAVKTSHKNQPTTPCNPGRWSELCTARKKFKSAVNSRRASWPNTPPTGPTRSTNHAIDSPTTLTPEESRA